MSNAWGAARFDDGLILYFLYHGTSDTCGNILRPTMNEVWDYVNQPSSDYDFKCSHNPESVEIYSDYGPGFYWKGTACRHCKRLIDHYYHGCWNPYSGEEVEPYRPTTDGKPPWYAQMWEK